MEKEVEEVEEEKEKKQKMKKNTNDQAIPPYLNPELMMASYCLILNRQCSGVVTPSQNGNIITHLRVQHRVIARLNGGLLERLIACVCRRDYKTSGQWTMKKLSLVGDD